MRGLEVHGVPVEVATGPTRVAVNLRGVPPTAVPRGSALTTPGRVPPGDACSTSRCTRSSRRLPDPRDPPRRHDDHPGARAPARSSTTRGSPSTMPLPLVAGRPGAAARPGRSRGARRRRPCSRPTPSRSPAAATPPGGRAVLAGGPTASAPSTPVTVAAVPDAVHRAARRPRRPARPPRRAPARARAGRPRGRRAANGASPTPSGRVAWCGSAGSCCPVTPWTVATARLGSLAAGFRAGRRGACPRDEPTRGDPGARAARRHRGDRAARGRHAHLRATPRRAAGQAVIVPPSNVPVSLPSPLSTVCAVGKP